MSRLASLAAAAGVGALGATWNNPQCSQALADLVEKICGRLPYAYNKEFRPHPVVFFDTLALPSAGSTATLNLFTDNADGVTTNWPGNSGLGADECFILEGIGIDIEPLVDLTAASPSFASTPLQINSASATGATNVTSINAANMESKRRYLQSCLYEFSIQGKIVTQGLGLKCLSPGLGADFAGAAQGALASSLTCMGSVSAGTPHRSNAIWFDHPWPIWPGQKPKLTITPRTAITFLDHSNAASASSVIGYLLGKWVKRWTD